MFLPMGRLEISPDEFRRVAERMVELAAELVAGTHSLPAFPKTSGEETERLFRSPLPETGLNASALDLLPEVIRHSRPPTSRFFGYVLGSGEPVAAAADLLASVLNQNLTAWRSSPAAVTIERTVVEWLAQAIGCAGFTGSLTGGGSSANLMGLAMAREAKAPANERGAQPCIVYASDEVHMSIPKALALLGLGRDNLRLVPPMSISACRSRGWSAPFTTTARPGSGRLPSWPPRAPSTPGPLTRCRKSPKSPASMGCGCTWTELMARWPPLLRRKNS